MERRRRGTASWTSGDVDVHALFHELSRLGIAPELRKQALGRVAPELHGNVVARVSTDSCMKVLCTVSMAKHWKQALHLWQFMQQSGLQPNSRAVGYVSESFVQGYSWASSLVVIDAMRAERMTPTSVCLGAMLEVNANRQLWQHALRQFLREGPDTRVGATRTFRALASAGELEQIRRLKKLAHEQKRYDTYGGVAKAFATTHAWEDSVDLIQDLRHDAQSPDLFQLEQLLAASSSAGRWREACLWVAQLDAKGEKQLLSVKLLTAALGACSRAGRLEEVRYFLSFMRRRGYWPSERTFNVAILACSRTGHWLLAMELLAEMRKAFRDPDIFSYTTCASAMKLASAWEASVEVLLQLGTTSLQVNEVTVSVAMKACEKGLEWKFPLHLLTRSIRSSLQLDLVACSSAIGALHEGMRWKASCDLLESAKHDNFALDIVAHNVAASSLEKVSRWERALSSLRHSSVQRLHANQAYFGVMLGACAKGENVLIAAKALQKMQQQGFWITPQFYGLALEACREVDSNAKALSWMLGELSWQLPPWLRRKHEDKTMRGVREASLALEMLDQHGALDHQIFQAFNRRACQPILSALAGVSRSARTRSRRALPGELAVLKEVGSLGRTFTGSVLEKLCFDVDLVGLKVATMWTTWARQTCRELLDREDLALRPSAETVLAWSSHRLSFSACSACSAAAAQGWDRDLSAPKGSGPVSHDVDLHPIFFEHERAEHAERQVLLRLLQCLRKTQVACCVWDSESQMFIVFDSFENMCLFSCLWPFCRFHDNLCSGWA